MPSLRCLCGNVLQLSAIPHPRGFHLVAETIMETIQERLASLTDAADPNQRERAIYEQLRLAPVPVPAVYECPSCGRIAVFAPPSNDTPIFYARDPQTTRRGDRSLVELSTRSVADPTTEGESDVR